MHGQPFLIPLTIHGCRTLYLHQVSLGHMCRSSSNFFLQCVNDVCLWHCLRRHNCLMLMYNTQHHYCLLVDDSCKEAEFDDSVTMTYLGPLRNGGDNGDHVCLQWRKTEDDWPQNLIIVNDHLWGRDYAVARISVGDILLPGAYIKGDTKSTIDGSKQMTDTGEYLLVHPTCSVLWLAWDTTSGSDLPTGAIVGGHLANGSPRRQGLG